jgi:hypothetical protein
VAKFDLPYVVAEGTTTYNSPAGQLIAWGDYFDAAPDVTSGNLVWLHGELAVSTTTWEMRATRVKTDAPTLHCTAQYLPGGVSCEAG